MNFKAGRQHQLNSCNFIYFLQLNGIELYNHLLISFLVIDILLIDVTHQLLICYTHKMNRLRVIQTELHKNRTLNTPLKHNNLCLPLHDIIFFDLLYNIIVQQSWVVHDFFSSNNMHHCFWLCFYVRLPQFFLLNENIVHATSVIFITQGI